MISGWAASKAGMTLSSIHWAVPLFTPQTDELGTSGTVYLWISSGPEDELHVGVDDSQGSWIPPVPPGMGGVIRKGEVEATILNQTSLSEVTRGGRGAVVVLDGRWPRSRRS